ncbi:MAG: CheY-like chemotaxis protein [Candidatus Azotimanducaceae bacterium]|jgi:CheY-like chemotaxis protein
MYGTAHFPQSHFMDLLSQIWLNLCNSSQEKKMNVLVVDDSRAMTFTVHDLVVHLGHTTTIAHSGNEACVLLRQQKFDVVITDYQMDDGNGEVVIDAVLRIEEKKRPACYLHSTSENTVTLMQKHYPAVICRTKKEHPKKIKAFLLQIAAIT